MVNWSGLKNECLFLIALISQSLETVLSQNWEAIIKLLNKYIEAREDSTVET